MIIINDIEKMGMYEMAGNCVYIKDKEVWYRNFDVDMPLRDFIRKVMKEQEILEDECQEDNDMFDEMMLDWVSYGYSDIRGIIASWYSNLWAMAEYREELQKLKVVERKNKKCLSNLEK